MGVLYVIKEETEAKWSLSVRGYDYQGNLALLSAEVSQEERESKKDKKRDIEKE